LSGSAGVEHEKRSKTVDMAKKGTKSEKHSGRLKGWKRDGAPSGTSLEEESGLRVKQAAGHS